MLPATAVLAAGIGDRRLGRTIVAKPANTAVRPPRIRNHFLYNCPRFRYKVWRRKIQRRSAGKTDP